MCGIFAYLGPRDDAPSIVLAGLKRLEYRGYDSWGVAAQHADGPRIIRRVGKIGGVATSVNGAEGPDLGPLAALSR